MLFLLICQEDFPPFYSTFQRITFFPQERFCPLLFLTKLPVLPLFPVAFNQISEYNKKLENNPELSEGGNQNGAMVGTF